MRRLLVISSDAQVGEDLEYLGTKKNFRKYLAGGAVVRNVSSIYPSVTFPAHATMMTGCYPERHGVTSNSQFPAFGEPVPWTWFSSFLKCDDIFHSAKRAGLSTSAVLWPVTAGNDAIDYHLPDFWAQGNETTEDAFRRTGSCEEVIDIVEKHKSVVEGRWQTHPYRDEFGILCARDIILEFAPEVMFVHPANIDAARHENGVFGPHIETALDDLDRWIGLLGSALGERGVLEDTDIFLVSDHGQMDVRRNIGLNVLFREKGWITLDKDGKISNWKVYCLSNGMSALIYVKDKKDIPEVKEYLDGLLEEGLYGFSAVIPEENARMEDHLGGDFAFVLETDGYTAFGDYCQRPLVRPLDNHDYRFGRATHGYHPSKGPQPMIVAKGPHIREGVVIKGSHIVNETPTYARLLSLDLRCDGHPIEEILK